MIYFSPKQLATKGLLITKPSEKTIRNMIVDGRLCALNTTPSLNRNTWKISQAEVAHFNKKILANKKHSL